MWEKLKGVLFIVMVGAVASAMLLAIRSYTFPIIKHNQEIVLKAAILQAAGLSYTSWDLHSVYDRNISEKKKNGFVYYLNPQGNYIFRFAGRGLWGPIEGVIALNPDQVTLEKVRIISQEETPGLGGRIAEEAYLKQFEGKKVAPQLKLVMRKEATGSTEVDAITGASLSSMALAGIINHAVEDFREKVR